MAPDIFPSTGVYILSTKKVATGAVSSEILNFETKLRQCNLIHSDGICAKYKIPCDFHMIVNTEDVVILNRKMGLRNRHYFTFEGNDVLLSFRLFLSCFFTFFPSFWFTENNIYKNLIWEQTKKENKPDFTVIHIKFDHF